MSGERERVTLPFRDTSRKDGSSRGSSAMKLRSLFLAAVAFVVLAGAIVPANASTYRHHRHHHHHHHHS